jgi:hypothetical protein
MIAGVILRRIGPARKFYRLNLSLSLRLSLISIVWCGLAWSEGIASLSGFRWITDALDVSEICRLIGLSRLSLHLLRRMHVLRRILRKVIVRRNLMKKHLWLLVVPLSFDDSFGGDWCWNMTYMPRPPTSC